MLDEIRVDICMWIYGFYITVLFTVFTWYMDWKTEYYELNNLEPTDDIVYFVWMEDNMCLMVGLITYVWALPQLYFNKAGGTYEDLIKCIFYWITRFFDFLYSILFVWECMWFVVVSSLFVLLVTFLYFILFFPFIVCSLCLLKFFYYFVQLYNQSVVFSLMLKAKFAIFFTITVTSLFVFFYPNFAAVYSWNTFIKLFFYILPIWLDFLPS